MVQRRRGFCSAPSHEATSRTLSGNDVFLDLTDGAAFSLRVILAGAERNSRSSGTETPSIAELHSAPAGERVPQGFGGCCGRGRGRGFGGCCSSSGLDGWGLTGCCRGVGLGGCCFSKEVLSVIVFSYSFRWAQVINGCHVPPDIAFVNCLVLQVSIDFNCPNFLAQNEVVLNGVALTRFYLELSYLSLRFSGTQ